MGRLTACMHATLVCLNSQEALPLLLIIELRVKEDVFGHIGGVDEDEALPGVLVREEVVARNMRRGRGQGAGGRRGYDGDQRADPGNGKR